MAVESSNQGIKKGGRIAGFVFLVMVILVLVCVIIVLLRGREAEVTEKRSVVVTSSNADEIINSMEEAEQIEVGYYAVTMNSTWHFATGKSQSSNAYVENIAENTNDVYFDLFLISDESKAIYKSPIIPVGASLSNFALDEALDAGTYDCVCIYHLIDKDQKTLSTLRVTATVIIDG